jgi:hypothetical protein
MVSWRLRYFGWGAEQKWIPPRLTETCLLIGVVGVVLNEAYAYDFRSGTKKYNL